jgi:DNA-3-methyladenine glycosylase
MSRFRPLPRSFYRRSAETVARDLLGRYLVRRIGGEGLPVERLVVRLVETEAYLGAPDRASHAWGGRRTARNESLYLAGGHAYVYLIYGLHHCLNVVTGERDVGSAVLLRAAEAVTGELPMKSNRGLDRRLRPGELAGGPGKLCQALAVDRRHDGISLLRGELVVTRGEPLAAERIAAGPRVGIDYAGAAAAWPLRFAEHGNREVSRPRPW